MTTETKTKSKAPTKILADVFLRVYQGEDHIFIKVASPDEIELEAETRQMHIRRFYRWANAVLGLTPEETWDGKLKWARLPEWKFINGKRNSVMRLLSKTFNLELVSEAEFYREEA